MMDHESDEEMSGKKYEVGSISNGDGPNKGGSPTSSAGDSSYSPNYDTESPMDNGPQSPDQEPRWTQSPQSPEKEALSPDNSGQAEDDDDNDDEDDDDASVEERASIHSDDEEENIENNEKENEAGEGTSGIDDSARESEKQKEESTNSKEKKDDERDSDSDSEVEELIADIFGESDEEEEFQGFGEEDLAKANQKNQKRKKTKALSDCEQDEEKKTVHGDEDKPEENQDRVKKNHRSIEIYDFDLMMERKKAEAGPRRRKRDHDSVITDSDDLIVDIIDQMKHAAREDRTLNRNKLAATKKLKLLPVVDSQLKKADLKIYFLEHGVLNVMSEWLSPLPDRSLPHLRIRQSLLKLLGEFPPIDRDTLKRGGIGRVVLYLYKHPKEIKENKVQAGRLISEWSRPIFNLRTDFQSFSKEDRENRDCERVPKKLKKRLEGGEKSALDIDTALARNEKTLCPGEKGWVGRARVPTPSTTDYIVRPKWNVETEFSKASKKQLTRLDKHIRILKEKKKRSNIQRAVTISIEGRKMSL